MSEEKVNKINDPMVRFGVGLYQILIYIVGAAVCIAMVRNIFMIGGMGYNYYNKWNNEKSLSEYVIEINTEDDIISKLHYKETKEEYLESIENINTKTIAIITAAKLIVFEIFLVLMFIYCLNLSNLLEKKKLNNPFNADILKFLNNAIKCGIFAWILSVLFLGNIAPISLSSLLFLVIIRYLIKKGIEYVNEN